MPSLFFALLVSAVSASAEEPVLSFQRSGKDVRELTLSQLAKKIPAQTVTVLDQVRGKSKTYKAFPIKEVMAAGFGKDWASFAETEASIQALDGFASLSAAAKLGEDGGWLTFEDVDTPGWEPIGRKKANPGPFYLVWAGEAQSRANEYPWPYQVGTINLVKFAERYPEVVPTGAPENSAAWRGFKTFRGQCLNCHAMNMQGSKIGPDLNAPQNVTAYRTKEWLVSYVRQPSKYRYTHMPDHTHLTDGELDDLYAYLAFKAKQPEKTW